MNNYDLEYIDNLRIHELRDFARRIGVSSPTTMKKEELIDKIVAIIESGKCDARGSTKFVNAEADVDFFSLLTTDNTTILSDLLSADNINDVKNVADEGNTTKLINKNSSILVKKSNKYVADIPYTSFNATFKLSQNDAIYNNDSSYSLSGYVDIHPDGYGILRQDGFVPSDNDAYMASSLVREHSLKKGQFIRCNAKYIMPGRPRVVYEIEEIDNISVKKSRNRRNFDDLPYDVAGDLYYLDKFNISMKQGERLYIGKMSLKEVVELSYDFVEENATRVKLVNIKARPEDNDKSNDKLEIIHIPFNKKPIEVVNTVELVIERVKREYEFGKENVIIIYNFAELMRSFNIAFEGCLDFTKINSQAVNKVLNLLYMSKNTTNDGCCSVICVDRDGIPRDMQSLMELELIPLFNKHYEGVDKK